MKVIFMIMAVCFLMGCEQDQQDACGTIGGSLISGEIAPSADKCNIDYKSTIELNSGGGSLSVAIRIADRIGVNESEVFVSNYCASACTALLTTASHRSICSDAYIGIHQGANQETTEKYLSFISLDGRIDIDAVSDALVKTSFNQMQVYNAYKAKSIGFVDQVIECD